MGISMCAVLYNRIQRVLECCNGVNGVELRWREERKKSK